MNATIKVAKIVEIKRTELVQIPGGIMIVEEPIGIAIEFAKVNVELSKLESTLTAMLNDDNVLVLDVKVIY